MKNVEQLVKQGTKHCETRRKTKTNSGECKYLKIKLFEVRTLKQIDYERKKT